MTDKSPANQPFLWLILPTYNERANLVRVVDLASKALASITDTKFKILVVDDNSPDLTWQLALDLAGSSNGTVELLRREKPEGLGPAYLAGFAHALAGGATHVFEMDADLSHDPADLPKLFAAVQAGADIAIGSRYVPGGGVSNWSRSRQVISRGGSFYARRILGSTIRDMTGGFKCFRADVLRQIELSTVVSRGYAFQVELTWRALRCGYKIVEVPITFREREHGESKMNAGIAIEAALLVPGLRRSGWKPTPGHPATAVTAQN